MLGSPGGEGNFEIGRILHLKFENRNLRSDSPACGVWQSDLRFRFSNLRCRIRPISKFPFPCPGEPKNVVPTRDQSHP